MSFVENIIICPSPSSGLPRIPDLVPHGMSHASWQTHTSCYTSRARPASSEGKQMLSKEKNAALSTAHGYLQATAGPIRNCVKYINYGLWALSHQTKFVLTKQSPGTTGRLHLQLSTPPKKKLFLAASLLGSIMISPPNCAIASTCKTPIIKNKSSDCKKTCILQLAGLFGIGCQARACLAWLLAEGSDQGRKGR